MAIWDFDWTHQINYWDIICKLYKMCLSHSMSSWRQLNNNTYLIYWKQCFFYQIQLVLQNNWLNIKLWIATVLRSNNLHKSASSRLNVAFVMSICPFTIQQIEISLNKGHHIVPVTRNIHAYESLLNLTNA